MGRSILAVFLGWATALFIIVVVEAAGHRLFPLPAGADIWSEAALRSAGPEIPATALILVVLGWAMGALGGGFLAGRLVQSAELASYDAWVKYYRPDENSNNVSVSYYTKGALLGFLLKRASGKAARTRRTQATTS